MVNASNALFTGRRLKFKDLRYHSGRPGGLKKLKYTDIMEKKPELMIFNAIYKMLPKNRTRLIHLENLKIYGGLKFFFIFRKLFIKYIFQIYLIQKILIINNCNKIIILLP